LQGLSFSDNTVEKSVNAPERADWGEKHELSVAAGVASVDATYVEDGVQREAEKPLPLEMCDVIAITGVVVPHLVFPSTAASGIARDVTVAVQNQVDSLSLFRPACVGLNVQMLTGLNGKSMSMRGMSI
jgi:hypothetical protein